jgi:hypothetical protein
MQRESSLSSVREEILTCVILATHWPKMLRCNAVRRNLRFGVSNPTKQE